MTDPLLDQAIASAQAYEALFVPALFGQFAPMVLDEARVEANQSVLDVACGTGVLAREARRRSGAAARIVGLDPGAGMLAVAEDLEPTIDWQVGRAESMPFPDGSFDVVLSQFGLMFMDRAAALQEMLRVLRPGGSLVVAVWGAVEDIPAYVDEIALLERLAGSPAADAVRAPFVLGNRDLLVGDLEAAGARSVTARTATGIARFPSVRVMIEADLRGWLPVMGVHLGEALIARILEEAEQVLEPYLSEGATVSFEVPAHIISASKGT